jgi:hypothetical protein
VPWVGAEGVVGAGAVVFRGCLEVGVGGPFAGGEEGAERGRGWWWGLLVSMVDARIHGIDWKSQVPVWYKVSGLSGRRLLFHTSELYRNY